MVSRSSNLGVQSKASRIRSVPATRLGGVARAPRGVAGVDRGAAARSTA